MDKKIKRRWLTALRSGKYKQGTGQLRRDTKRGPRHCCLGVLCDVMKQPYGDHDTMPSRLFRITNGLENSVVVSGKSTTIANALVGMNDGAYVGHRVIRRTFSTIANWIEANL